MAFGMTKMYRKYVDWTQRLEGSFGRSYRHWGPHHLRMMNLRSPKFAVDMQLGDIPTSGASSLSEQKDG